MATLLVTNLSSSKVYLRDAYTTLEAAGDVNNKDEVSFVRPVSALAGMTGLQALMTAGTVSLSVTLSADELGSGLSSPPNSIGADDILEVASTGLISPDIVIRKELTAGVAGAGDVVTVYAAGALPFKFRVIDAWIYVSAGNSGGRTVTIQNKAATPTVTSGTLSAASAGRAPIVPDSNVSTVYTPGAAIGLFLARSHDAVAGEVFIRVRRES